MSRETPLKSISAAARERARRKVSAWFTTRKWKVFPFQKDTWSAYLDGHSGLIHATTGTGKTLAAWLGPVIEALAEAESKPAAISDGPTRVLWITPLRALAIDTLHSLKQPATELGLNWSIESRTGDTSAADRQRQRRRLPTVLVTTPESLSLLLARSDAVEQFRELRTVICDEWHELLATKRGVQVELALARLRRWKPQLRTWALSATLGNLDEALQVLLGASVRPDTPSEPSKAALTEVADTVNAAVQSPSSAVDSSAVVTRSSVHLVSSPTRQPILSDGDELPSTGPPPARVPPGLIVRAGVKKTVVVDSLIPARIERFPWAGHMGMSQLSDVLNCIESANSTLVFTNTRSQTEAWYHAILQARRDWAGLIALHHGSLEPQTRTWVEEGLRQGKLRCVVCTSSLDLGVDFSPVDRVLQVGSPRGVARLLQRAGRSGHQPGAVSRVTCVPTHAFELIEAAAARDAMEAGQLEGRQPHRAPIDVLCQHLVTIACGEGFESTALFDEVRGTLSYADLQRSEWDWALNFAARGGESLKAYPDYHRLREEQGRFLVSTEKIARQHRMSIGTITSDASLVVQYLNGPALGTIEESFLTKLNPGDCFLFSGRAVELVHIHDMKVWVRKAPASARAVIPRWMGGRMPLSSELAYAVRQRLREAHNGEFRGPELQAVRPLLELQAEWSALPLPEDLLVEQIRSREGFHLLIYPFAGRLVHEGLAALCAWRMAQLQPITFTMSVNDYGFELLSPTEAPLDAALDAGLLEETNLAVDLEKCLNAAEMGKRQFREIARVAGLVFQGYPGQQRTARQLQASSGLLYDVFSNYDPENLLLRQSRTEVLERQLEHTRLVSTLRSLQAARIVRRRPQRLTPLAFPLVVARLRERLSSEKLSDRIARMTLQLEKAAGS
jgi:ATP-dependent Lhr-like helicase